MAFFNFVVTGYSLIDWIKHDPTVPASAKEQIQIDALYTDTWLKVCGDLATAAKHFKFTIRVPEMSSASSSSGYGMGRFGKGGFGVGEESINIVLNDGTSYNGLDFLQGVLSSWDAFFLKHGIWEPTTRSSGRRHFAAVSSLRSAPLNAGVRGIYAVKRIY